MPGCEGAAARWDQQDLHQPLGLPDEERKRVGHEAVDRAENYVQLLLRHPTDQQPIVLRARTRGRTLQQALRGLPGRLCTGRHRLRPDNP